MLKIWVDCDGVLCDFVGGYLSILKSLPFGAPCTLEHKDVVHWDLSRLSSEHDADCVWSRVDS